jgi:hypothetical protein
MAARFDCYCHDDRFCAPSEEDHVLILGSVRQGKQLPGFLNVSSQPALCFWALAASQLPFRANDLPEMHLQSPGPLLSDGSLSYLSWLSHGVLLF